MAHHDDDLAARREILTEEALQSSNESLQERLFSLTLSSRDFMGNRIFGHHSEEEREAIREELRKRGIEPCE